MYNQTRVCLMWRYNKLLAPLLIAIGFAVVALTFSSLDELSAPAHFVLILGISYAAYVVWDMILLKDVSTIQMIVDDRNLAYAIHQLIPALLAIAAACAL